MAMSLSPRVFVVIAFTFVAGFGLNVGQDPATGTPVRVRVATYNIGDVRTADLSVSDHPRLLKIAHEIRELRPDMILLNEIAYDWAVDDSGVSGSNLDRFVKTYLSESGAADSLSSRRSIHYRALMLPPNTGLPSGFDLDRNGSVVTKPPELPESSDDDKPGPQTPEGRAYGGDSWGFGMFPGQYGFGILVSDRFDIVMDEVRTFRSYKWSSLPSPLRPIDPVSGDSWYPDDAWELFPLSSKSHADIPVQFGPETVLHVLASHPTPPAFDGPEMRNRYRNHDEIRFWSYYLDNAEWIVDDQMQAGGLSSDQPFVIMGDLNADPDEGSSFGNPIESFLFDHPRVDGTFVPEADADIEGLDADDTATWGLRVDYILPSVGITVEGGAVHRHSYSPDEPPSDHFPVWLDLVMSSDASPEHSLH